jgi:hypothetical protein
VLRVKGLWCRFVSVHDVRVKLTILGFRFKSKDSGLRSQNVGIFRNRVDCMCTVTV